MVRELKEENIDLEQVIKIQQTQINYFQVSNRVICSNKRRV